MAQCNEFDPSMVEAIEAYPMEVMSIGVIPYEHYASLTSQDLDLSAFVTSKQTLPMSDKPSYEDSPNMARPGRMYDVTINVPFRNPDDNQLSVIEAVESEPHVLLIKCFGDVSFIITPAAESYNCEHNTKDGIGNIKITCQNASGLIPYFDVQSM